MVLLGWLRGLAGVSTLVLLGGCGELHAEGCTLVDTTSGIMIDYASVTVQHPHERFALRACLGSVCRTQRYRTLHPGITFVAFSRNLLSDGEPQAVQVTISDFAGGRLFHGQTEVTARKTEINGPGCPPTTWVGKVVATGSDTLTPAEPVWDPGARRGQRASPPERSGSDGTDSSTAE